MTGYEMIARIDQMAQCSMQYRANWKLTVEKMAAGVVAEVVRLRAFAKLKTGFVADRCNATANDLETKLQKVLTQFGAEAQ